MKVSRITAIFLFMPLLLLPTALVHAQPTTFNDTQNAVFTAYRAILNSTNSGVDTNKLVAQLNQAINLTSQAQALNNSNPQQTQTLLEQAQTVAQNVTSQALAQKNVFTFQPITIGFTIAALLISGSIVYFFGPRLFWKMWLSLRKQYQVKIGNPANQTKNNKNLIVTAEQVCAAILGITIIIAFIATVPYFLPKGTSERFSELGILGPDMKLGDYPQQIVASQTVNLYTYIGNQMGRPIYYDIMVKLGDNNTVVDPSPITPIQQFTQVLANNATWTFPVNVTLTQPGLNQRIIFEVWIYNETLDQMQYNQEWGQVWLNVTAPAS